MTLREHLDKLAWGDIRPRVIERGKGMKEGIMTGDVLGVPFERCSDEMLIREYLAMNKAAFDCMFGHNAERQRASVATELARRGITEIPNIFGAIPIRA